MRIATETSYHDVSQDDNEQFNQNFDEIFGKPWYEQEDNASDNNA